MSRLRTMQVVVNGAVLGGLVVIPAYLDQTHAQNQKDVLAIDNLPPHPRPFSAGQKVIDSTVLSPERN